MSSLRNLLTIRSCLGGSSFLSGLICFAFGSTYDELFGKLGFGGFVIYVGISLFICYLICGVKGITVPEAVQDVVETMIAVSICYISVVLGELIAAKDVLTIISYGLFALMVASMSKKSELGFATVFFAFSTSLFNEQLFKMNENLLPVALVFGLVTILLRRRSDSCGQNGSEPAVQNGSEPAVQNGSESRGHVVTMDPNNRANFPQRV